MAVDKFKEALGSKEEEVDEDMSNDKGNFLPQFIFFLVTKNNLW